MKRNTCALPSLCQILEIMALKELEFPQKSHARRKAKLKPGQPEKHLPGGLFLTNLTIRSFCKQSRTETTPPPG